MSSSIDFNDPNAWDDTSLVDSWNSALKEYKKYHSIHAQGKKLSEVLTKDEVEELSKNGIDIYNSSSKNTVDVINNRQEQEEKTEDPIHDTPMDNIPESHQSEPPIAEAGHQVAAVPSVLMNSVKDESVKNLMMAWYWAGYYTGYHEGQQSKNTPS